MPTQSFYAQSQQEILRLLSSSERGLSQEEAKKRLAENGQNALTAKKKVSALSIFLSQFQNSLIIILLVAALLIFFVWYFGERESADLVEGILILAIVLMITLLGFFQEWKAEKAIEALKNLLAFHSKVMRDGKHVEVDAKTLVPGDIVVLEEGTKIPADLRLLDVASLLVNEASLTGESAPASKTVDPIQSKQHLPMGDQKNMAFSGTVIVSGRGTGVVVATGDKTEIGQIASAVAETVDDPTPIQKRLDQISKILGWAILAICAVVFVFVVFFAEEFSYLGLFERVMQSFIAAISLAVAAIPEGLPAVVTVALALGTERMLRRKTLVRKLNAVETLGSTDVICADKTGTLTKGEMTVKEVWIYGKTFAVSGSGYDQKGDFTLDNKRVRPDELQPILLAGLVANNADLEKEKILGDPTEAALLVAAAKAGVSSKATRIKEIPFSSERKMMTVLVREGSATHVYSKGAPEVILRHCTKILHDNKILPLTEKRKKEILAETEKMSERALRTLGFAYKTGLSDPESSLVFLGLMGMIDPPRTEIAPLIQQCADSGIRVIMITGDHAATAAAVAKEIGMVGKTMTGQELDGLSEKEFSTAVKEVNVYARVNPGFKMRIVQALQAMGSTVAMTGDGVNDAPALKKADIGIAMGITGTDVAKEASDMVLLDDHFSSIVAAVEEGRGIFENIKRFVNYLLSSNITEVIVIFLGVLLFRDVLLSATMLLWINVVTDGLPAIALGMDPARPGILAEKPQLFQAAIINKKIWVEMIIFGVLSSAVILIVYWLNVPEGHLEARSAAFVSIVILEFVRLFQIRAKSKLPFFSNSWLMSAIAVSLILQFVILYVPFFAQLFRVTPIDSSDWIVIGVGALTIWILVALQARLPSSSPTPVASPHPL